MSPRFKLKILLLGSFIVFLGMIYGTHRFIVNKSVSKAIAETQAALQAEHTQKLLEASELAREREQSMVESAEQIRKEKDAQIASLNTRLGAALSSLSERPSRPSSTSQGPSASCTCQGATGAELSREDGSFLAREAARADRLRAALDQCYKQYDSVRESLK